MTPHPQLSALNPHSSARLFPDDEFRVVNAADASKQLAFDLSAITTGTTRTLTIPDASGTMALLEREQTFTKAVTFALGLTVAGAAFASRGIQDDATTRALTLSGSGANSITIANSATNPTIGTSAGNLSLSAAGVQGLLLAPNATANTYAQFTLPASGNNYAALLSQGSGADVGMFLGAKGTGAVAFYTNGLTDLQVAITATASANRYITLTGSNGGNPTIGTSAGDLVLNSTGKVAQFTAAGAPANYIRFQSRNAGAGPILWAEGSDTGADVPMEYRTQNAGAHLFITDDSVGTVQVAITHTASANRYITLTGSTDAPTVGTSAGDLKLAPATGVVRFGTYSAKGAEAFAGYITIKDEAGNSRKVMVCA